MSRATGHHHHHHRVRHRVRKQVLFLFRSACDLWHQCRSRALETIENGKRFSLISRSSDYQATFTAQYARNNLQHRRSVPSEQQISGFHVVCAECDGFVVRDGAVRNCAHQRGSWSSVVSSRSREVRREYAGKLGAQATSDVRISAQPPTPGSSPEPDTHGKSRESAGLRSTNATSIKARRPIEYKVREPIPAILRPGYVADDPGARTMELTGEATMSDTSIPPKFSGRIGATDKESADLSLYAGNAAQKLRPPRQDPGSGSVDRSSTDQPFRNPETLMQDWRKWSEKWERSVTREKPGGNNHGGSDQRLCDPDALMQEWREWSERWERSVTSR